MLIMFGKLIFILDPAGSLIFHAHWRFLGIEYMGYPGDDITFVLSSIDP